MKVNIVEDELKKSDFSKFSETSKFASNLSSYVGIENTIYDKDNGTRFYILPTGQVVKGVGGCLKIFADAYQNGEDYRDLGIYFSADQKDDKGYNGNGVNWINVKVLDGGKYNNKWPDIGFSFQDGKYVSGRFVCFPNGETVLVLGKNLPKSHKSGVSSVLELQGNATIVDNKSVRFLKSDNTHGADICVTESGIFKESLLCNKNTYINGELIQSVEKDKVKVNRPLQADDGVILTSPSGKRYKLNIDDNGTLSSTLIT